jgi:hypothetical protein
LQRIAANMGPTWGHSAIHGRQVRPPATGFIGLIRKKANASGYLDR